MKRNYKLIATASLTAVAAAAATTALATAGDAPPAVKSFVPNELPIVVPKQNNVGAAHQTSAKAFRAHIEASGAAATTDWSTLKSFSIAGTELNGWTFNGGGQDCLAVPDPVVEGYAVKCGDETEVAEGEVALVIAPAIQTGKPAVAAAISAAPASISGSKPGSWKRTGKVTAGKVDDGAVIQIGSRRVTVERDKATKLVAAER